MVCITRTPAVIRASWVIGASTDCDVHFYGLVVTGLVRLEIIIYIYALPSSK